MLPTWFVEEAKDICNQTLNGGGGKPLAKRIEEAINGFGLMSVTKAQLEEKLGVPVAKWVKRDVAHFGVIYKSIQRGESPKDKEFPSDQAPARVAVGEKITGQPAPAANGHAPAPEAAPAADPPPAAEAEDGAEPGSISTQQVGQLKSLFQDNLSSSSGPQPARPSRSPGSRSSAGN